MSSFEKQRPKVGVAVIVAKDGAILLGKRRGSHGAGMWACPGGHLEFGESVEECASRELLEETGLKIRSLRLGPWVSDVIEGDKHYITLFVFVDAFEGEVQLLEPHKCEGWEWFSTEALPTSLFPPIVSFIEKSGMGVYL